MNRRNTNAIERALIKLNETITQLEPYHGHPTVDSFLVECNQIICAYYDNQQDATPQQEIYTHPQARLVHKLHQNLQKDITLLNKNLDKKLAIATEEFNQLNEQIRNTQ
eukprot:TRINITY_DN2569_c0_g1_i3.p2 TRINITY_DN2569_c0_g1~~TRINITY_DN2569_c0_g1_i3.p2  ORF type:complete len:109 (+),score=17.61 TRINITY_DN2569_c0_g1_i3:488-814(+)